MSSSSAQLEELIFISSVLVLVFLMITVFGGHMPNIHFILNKHIKDSSDCNIKC